MFDSTEVPAPLANEDGVRLMLRFQQGDESAFEALFERYKAAVFRFAFRYFNDADTAEDLTQQAFLRVYKSKAAYRPSAKFTTWLYRITTNLCLNALRARKHDGQPLISDEQTDMPDYEDKTLPGPEASLAQSERLKAVAEAIQSLPATQRVLILLTYYEDLPIVEAAAAAGVTAVGARLRLFRAREQLRKKLKDLA